MPLSLSSFSSSLKVVIVGASGGIGQALVDNFIEREQVDQLIGLSRTPTNSIPQDYQHKYQHYPIDYESEASIQVAAEQLPADIDIVIIATGLLHQPDGMRPEKSYKQLDGEYLQQALLVNLVGPSLVAKYLLPKMHKQRKAVMAALSARVGSISDNRLGGWYAYRSAKAGLNMMVKTLSVELARSQPNVIIASLHPGTVDTDLSKPFQRNVPPEKLFCKDFSAQCLVNVINRFTINDSGRCFAWDGKAIPP